MPGSVDMLGWVMGMVLRKNGRGTGLELGFGFLVIFLHLKWLKTSTWEMKQNNPKDNRHHNQ